MAKKPVSGEPRGQSAGARAPELPVGDTVEIMMYRVPGLTSEVRLTPGPKSREGLRKLLEAQTAVDASGVVFSEIDATLERLDVGIVRENERMDEILSRLRRTRIAA